MKLKLQKHIHPTIIIKHQPKMGLQGYTAVELQPLAEGNQPRGDSLFLDCK